jgi:hypothetical protein
MTMVPMLPRGQLMEMAMCQHVCRVGADSTETWQDYLGAEEPELEENEAAKTQKERRSCRQL